jgi:hypothetical protein
MRLKTGYRVGVDGERDGWKFRSRHSCFIEDMLYRSNFLYNEIGPHLSTSSEHPYRALPTPGTMRERSSLGSEANGPFFALWLFPGIN